MSQGLIGMKKYKTKYGFTLIELLVVISIISMLASVVMASLNGARDKANEAKKIMEVRSVNTALKMYAMNKGAAPGNYEFENSVAVPAQEGTDAYNQSMQELVTAGVLPTIPKSPDGKSYYYFDYGGPNGEGGTFYASWSGVCGSTISGSDGFTYGTVLAEDGKCWFDRNLGASRVATASNDSASYGYYYQWGRFHDDHEVPTSGITITQSSGDNPGNSLFIYGHNDWRNPSNDNLWQDVVGTNNPCPAGFRLPSSSEWATLVSDAHITNVAAAFSSKLKLPAAGYRDPASAVLYNQNSMVGLYWSSNPVPAEISYSYHVYFDSGSIVSNMDDPRAYGFSVRCIGN
jgi:uncharacterized protein (TIGR02145 family)/prepilin-type N-terminal cleavage/methylation domain-containing protein